MTLETRPFDIAEYLDDETVIAGFISDALESGDKAEIAEAIGAVARARGMTEIARQAGVARESLYRSLSLNGDPQLSTLIGVLKACGVKLIAAPASSAPKRRTRTRRKKAA